MTENSNRQPTEMFEPEAGQINFFKKYKADCNVFFETGSHMGDTIERSLLLGYEKVISVELNPTRHVHCCNRFSEDIKNGRVFLFQGNTIDRFDEMCSLLDPSDKCFFWLDAHDDGGGVPALEELEILKKYNRKNDVIAIDDIVIYYQASVPKMEQSLKEINENYNIYFDDVHKRGIDAIMIATEEIINNENQNN